MGYIITINGKKVAIVGDSDNTDELRNIKTDILLIPIGGTYTMNVEEAVNATLSIKPKLVIPTHNGSIVGDLSLGKDFETLIKGKVDYKILI